MPATNIQSCHVNAPHPGAFLRTLLPALIVLALLSESSFAQFIAIGRTLGDTHQSLEPVDNGYGFYNIDGFVKVNRYDRVADAGLFLEQTRRFENGGAGGVGMVANARDDNDQPVPQVASFHIFDSPVFGNTGDVSPAHSNCETYMLVENEYLVQCLAKFDWTVGREYRLRTWSLGEQSNGKTRWGSWVMDLANGEETFIGAIDVPADWKGLSSFAPSYVGYLPYRNSSCSDIPNTVTTFRNPTANAGNVVTVSTLPLGNSPCGVVSVKDLGGSSVIKTGEAADFSGNYRLKSSWDARNPYISRWGVPDGRGGWIPGSVIGFEPLDDRTRNWESMKWSFEYAGDGLYRIKNLWGSTRGYLSRAARWDESTSKWIPTNKVYFDALRQHWRSQKWRIVFDRNNDFRIISDYGSDGILSRIENQNPDGISRPGNRLQLEEYRFVDAQAWQLEVY